METKAQEEPERPSRPELLLKLKRFHNNAHLTIDPPLKILPIESSFQLSQLPLRVHDESRGIAAHLGNPFQTHLGF